jgi:hypothetical protein
VLGYHGCSEAVGERLLRNEPFEPSGNLYDWLGTGIYFWEANPDRARDWAAEVAMRRKDKAFRPFVVGAVIDLGFCLDLMSTNGIQAVEQAHGGLVAAAKSSKLELPVNKEGEDLLFRNLDRAVMEYLHAVRAQQGESPIETVRALFPEAEQLYPNAGFRRKTHVQIRVRNARQIKGVFRVPNEHFTER